ncbi:hypothetical protein G9A89_004163 [Geosiphon pyriformis]|nr:hypothetical protein G9A89_004163 [Geosiphon pyriformis]
MENKEINSYRPDAHDCNLCKECQWSIKDNGDNEYFSSGNEEVDEIIKNPIYIPPGSEYNYDKVKYYEWIPWEHLSNIHKIARGGFGIIYKATLIDGLIDISSMKHHGEMEYKRWRVREEVAIKIIPINTLNIQRAMFIKNGNLYINKISSIWGITQNAETLEYGILMGFAKHGDMRKYLSINFHSTSWSDKLLIAYDIASGHAKIHSAGMIHRDLHSGNILQYYFSAVQIGDLGLCQSVNHEATTTTTTTGKAKKKKKIYGVIPYISPEVLRGEKFTKKGDIYSFSMLLWELATGKPPFYDCSHDHILIMGILNGQRPKITSPLIPPCLVEIIEKCWDPNPENRPTAKEVDAVLRKLEPSNAEFSESNNYVWEMVEGDDSTTTTTTTPTPLHPGAVYTSRL